MMAPLRAYACLAASMALVGSYVGLAGVLFAAFPLFVLAWLRFAIAAMAMARWTWQAAREAPLGARERWLLFWESLLGSFLFSAFMLPGVALTSAVTAGVVMAAIPAAVALLSRVFLREPIAPRVAAAIALAVGGIALAAWARRGGAAPGASAWGVPLLVAAVFCEASYVVIGKRLAASVSPERISVVINAWALALATPVAAWQVTRFDFATVGAGAWVLLVFYALAASVWTVRLWMAGLRHVPASAAGVYTALLPISAAAVGVALLGERISALQGAAFALALAGVALATVRR